MVHACKIANEAETAIAIRRASGFNELYETVLNKECKLQSEPGLAWEMAEEGGRTANEKGKDKQRFGPEVQKLTKLVKEVVMEKGALKWTWGADLTEDDLRDLSWGADCQQDQIPHSGYDEDLASGSLLSQTSLLDPANLEDPNDEGVHFDSLSNSITIIPELPPHQIPEYSAFVPAECDLGDSEPDPAIEAFAKRAKEEGLKITKLMMQDEVNQAASFGDWGTEFIPQMALIPCHPWLLPCLPIILPPTIIGHHVNTTDPDIHEEVPDYISVPDSDDIPDHMSIPDSDHNPDHGMTVDSDSVSSSSQIHFPVSDEGSLMDVVGSDEHNSGSDTIPDQILLSPSGSPMAARQPTVRLQLLPRINRRDNKGRFTADSFANFPDEFLD